MADSSAILFFGLLNNWLHKLVRLAFECAGVGSGHPREDMLIQIASHSSKILT